MDDMKKILFIDFDGTMLADDKSLPSGNKEAVEKVLDAGLFVAFNTGRSVNSGMMLLDSFGISHPNIYMISFQGNMIYHPDTDRVLYESGIDLKEGTDLLKLVNSKGIYAQTYNEKGLMTIEDCYDLQNYVRITGEPVQRIDSWDDIRNETIPKVICIDYKESGKLTAMYDEYHASGDEKFECFFSSPWYLEFTKKGTDKGVGIVKMCEILGIDTRDSYAIGDEENDIPLLKVAGFGAAVANAREELKAVADMVCIRDNNNGGFAEFCDYILKDL